MDARAWTIRRAGPWGPKAPRHAWRWARALAATAALVLAVMVPPAVAAEGPIAASVAVNGQPGATSLGALQQGGTWYFQAAGLLQALGMRVGQASTGGEVTATGEDMRLGITVGSTTAYLDGAAIDLGAAPLQVGGAVYVPFSLVGLLGAQASWNAAGAALTVADPALAPTAAITATSGGVQLFTNSGSAGTAALGQNLAPGDSVVTAGDGSAQIQMSDGSLIDVAPNSNLQLTALSAGSTAGSRVASFRLLVGRILARIFDLGGGTSDLAVNTPVAVIGDRGTTFLVEVAPSGATTAAVLSGQITLADEGGQGAPVSLDTDQQSAVSAPQVAATPPVGVSGVSVDTWLAHAVADTTVARVAENLAPQQPAASQQVLLTTALPAIQKTLDQLSGKPFVGHVTTTGGARADLGGQAAPGNGKALGPTSSSPTAGSAGSPPANPANAAGGAGNVPGGNGNGGGGTAGASTSNGNAGGNGNGAASGGTSGTTTSNGTAGRNGNGAASSGTSGASTSNGNAGGSSNGAASGGTSGTSTSNGTGNGGGSGNGAASGGTSGTTTSNGTGNGGGSGNGAASGGTSGTTTSNGTGNGGGSGNGAASGGTSGTTTSNGAGNGGGAGGTPATGGSSNGSGSGGTGSTSGTSGSGGNGTGSGASGGGGTSTCNSGGHGSNACGSTSGSSTGGSVTTVQAGSPYLL